MLTASALIARAALTRQHSIGTHTLTESSAQIEGTPSPHQHTIWVRGSSKPVLTTNISTLNTTNRDPNAIHIEPNTNLGVSKN